jgi:ectoine hydroxylase
MSADRLTTQQIAQYQEDGYLQLDGLFDAEEVALLLKIAKTDQRMAADAQGRQDADGRISKLTLRNDLEDDIYSAFVRCPRIVEPMQQLLGGEVYHWHHKMMLKEPRVGGAWEWHQDYGYWYAQCLYPLLASCMIAVDRSTQENGCLQVLKGSHQIGRIEHGVTGEQVGADLERVEAAQEQMDLVHCELEPGTALFFDGNLLHCSAQNRSENPRWSLICCYNAARNSPYKQVAGGHPDYSKLEMCDDALIKEVGRRQLAQV